MIFSGTKDIADSPAEGNAQKIQNPFNPQNKRIFLVSSFSKFKKNDKDSTSETKIKIKKSALSAKSA